MSYVGGASTNNSLQPGSGMRGWNDPPDVYSMQCTNSGTSDNPFRRKLAPKTTTNRSNNLSGTSNQMSSTVSFFDPTKVQTPLSQMSSAPNFYPNNLSMGDNNQKVQPLSPSGMQQLGAPYTNGVHSIPGSNYSTQNGHGYPTQNGHSHPFATQPAVHSSDDEWKGNNMGQQINNIPPTVNGNVAYNNGTPWTENGYSNVPLYNNFSNNSNHTQQSNSPYSN